MENRKSVTVVLVEDDPGHAKLIKKNLQKGGINNPFIILNDGQKAVDFLFGKGEYEGKARLSPLLVLLDLNMPLVDGYQVLKMMKEDNTTKKIPVVVLTTTENPSEVQRCYELGCNVFVTKPVEYEEFAEAMRKLGLFIEIMMVPDID
ncbi:MAG: response regulator [Nitrospinota bacterium]